MTDRSRWLAVTLAGLTVAAPLRVAQACGCFAPPSPMTPVVQAGERILFAHDGDHVIAYIQIQYQGSADDFGWLVPLPSVPTLELGSDEVFTTLQAQTNPQYSITTQRNFCDGSSSRSSSDSDFGCGSFAADEASGFAAADQGAFAGDLASADNSALVLKDSIGPYDYAVLKADDKTAMLAWLDQNRYYVPDATGEAVAPYIHAGGYFLALKLRAGESAGDVVPVVLRYKSDLPMIPITLTQVGAIPNMGVLVWNLGEARAIPRNYYHVVLNEMPIWESLLDYPRQVIKAVREAPRRHAFVTEYAGSSTVMNQVFYAGRFGELSYLRGLNSPIAYMSYLQSNGYTFDATLISILRRYLPIPQQLANAGVSESQYYRNFANYGSYTTPIDADAGAPADFDPAGLTDEITIRVVRPIRAAAQLFLQHPYLTRLYTALSPEDMNVDPVFSENPDLPDVPRQHSATLTIPCRGDGWLRTETGLEEQWVSNLPPSKIWPAAARIELLREAGPPQIATDNEAEIAAKLGPVNYGTVGTPPPRVGPDDEAGCACDLRHRVPSGALGTFVLVAAAILIARRRKAA